MRQAISKYCVLSIILLSMGIHQTISVFAYSYSFDSSAMCFKLDYDGSRLIFGDDTIYLGDGNLLWSWVDDDAIQFYSLEMGESQCPSTWNIKISGPANVTVNKLFERVEADVLELDIVSSTVALLEVYCGSYGKPSVEGADTDGVYSSETQKITFSKTGSGVVTLSWSPQFVWNPSLYEDPFLLMKQYLPYGDFIGFLWAIWYSLLGDVFQCLIILIITIPLYFRTEKIEYPSFIMILLSGSFTLSMLPIIAFRIHHIFLIFGILGILYRVFGEKE